MRYEISFHSFSSSVKRYLPPVLPSSTISSPPSDQSIPLIVIIHGGPQVAVSDGFHFR